MKICKNCGTQNNDDFLFCKRCGNELDNSQNTYNTNSPFTQNPFEPYIAEDFDGVSKEEMKAYIGKNSDGIIRKFSEMQLKNKKSAWCAPPFVLSLLLGLPGAAFWFIYRKMYKIGILILAIGIAFNIATTYFNSDEIKSEIPQLLSGEDYITDKGNEANNDDYITDKGDSAFKGKNKIGNSVLYFSGYLSDIIRVGISLLFGFYSLYFYKKKAVGDIKAFASANSNHPYYLYGISLQGGQNTGGVVLAVIAYVVLTMAPYFYLMYEIFNTSF